MMDYNPDEKFVALNGEKVIPKGSDLQWHQKSRDSFPGFSLCIFPTTATYESFAGRRLTETTPSAFS